MSLIVNENFLIFHLDFHLLVSYKHKEIDHYPVHHHEPSHHESGWGSSADHHGYDSGYGGGDLAGYGNHYSLRYLHHK